MSLFDGIAAVAASVLGFLLALALIAVLELLSGELWLVGVGLLIVIAGIVLFETVTDWLMGGLVRKVAKGSVAEAEERRASAVARYAAAAGVVLAFLATRVWTPEQILGVF